MNDLPLSVAQFVPATEAEGPGRRFALWFQGCPLRCPGCCNPEFLPFKGGTSWTVDAMVAEIEKAHREHAIEGITLIGGEPTAHAAPAAAIARAMWQRSLTVMVFSGYTLDEIRGKRDADVDDLIAHTDILVDGPYLRDQPDTQRRWVGSRNQGIHFLTGRYRADDPAWKQKNTLEIRLDAEGLTINGFPAAHAVQLWKGWKPPRPSGSSS